MQAKVLKLWYKNWDFCKQDKEVGINPTFEAFCLRKIKSRKPAFCTAVPLTCNPPLPLRVGEILLNHLTSVKLRV